MSRARVAMILTRFPQHSETYIKVEIEALREIYDIQVIALEDSNLRYVHHHPYRVVELAGNKMSYELDDDAGALTAAVREIRPDILHTHYLQNVRLLTTLSQRTGAPFTVRAHSYELMAPEFRRAMGGAMAPSPCLRDAAPLINADECLGVLSFPYTLPAYEQAGVDMDKVVPCYPVVDFRAFYNRDPVGSDILNVEPCLPKKRVTDFVDIANLAPMQRFNLYPLGHQLEQVRAYNALHGSPVHIHEPVEPEQMPAVYKQHSWLVYTACFERGNMGWPVAVFEAQAAGLGVCVANVHPRVRDQLGGAGFTYDTIEEVPGILAQPYPVEMRERGFENARLADVEAHKHLLTGLWSTALGH